MARHDEEATVSPTHCRVSLLFPDRARVQNISDDDLPLRLGDKPELAAGQSRDVALPVTFSLGGRVLTFSLDGAASSQQLPAASSRFPAEALVGGGIAVEVVLGWLRTTLTVLQSAANSPDFFDQAARAVVDIIGLDSGQVVRWESNRWNTVAVHTASGASARPPSTHLLEQARNAKQCIVERPATVATPASQLGLSLMVATPIVDRRGNVLAVLYGDRLADDRSMSALPVREVEALLLQMLASGVGAGLSRLEQEQTQRDLDFGARVQAEFFPEGLPEVAGWEMARHFRPAQQVGGDFYDVFRLTPGHIALVIGDVCGHGIGAGLYVGVYRSLLRAFAQHAEGRERPDWPGVAARSAVALTNKYMTDTHRKQLMLASLFFGILNLSTGELTYVNAGHPPPLVVGGTGVRKELRLTGFQAGAFPDCVYEVEKAGLAPGETLVAYTDGVYEAANDTRQRYTSGVRSSRFCKKPADRRRRPHQNDR